MFASGSSAKRILLAAVAQGVAACLFLSPAVALTVPRAGDPQLSINRMFAGPATSDALQFSIPVQTATVISDSVFGRTVPSELTAKSVAVQPRPELFSRMLDSSYSVYDQPGLKTDETAAIAGVRFRLFGGEQTVTLQSVGKNFGAPNALNNPGPAPALFAFYNFRQLSQLTENPSGTNVAPNLLLQNGGAQALGALSFPSINTVAPQTASLFTNLVPNTHSAAVEFRFPLVFSGVNANVHLSAASLRGVGPDSLATQIFGPAFASSVTRKYNSLGGGVTLALPLFDRKATVSLDGLYESLKRSDKSSYLYAANANYLANNPNALPYNTVAGTSLNPISVPSALYFYPNFIDIHRFASGASLAVPVTKALTVNGGFSEQRYNAEALNTLTQDLNQGSRSISGGLVYNIPKTNSSIDLFFNRYQYFDEDVPASNRTENRQNIYFSVKF